MANTIDNQVMSMKVQKFLDLSQGQLKESAERLSSGLRINSAKDDAAGLAIAERMNSEIRSMNAGMRNAYDGISMVQIAEGGLKQVTENLQRMRELAVQSANGSNSAADRENLNAEFSALNSDISRIAATTMFNGEAVLDGDGESINYQVGSGTHEDNTMSVNLLGLEPLGANINTAEASLNSIDLIDSLIAEVTGARANFGAVQSRFESTITNLQSGVESLSAAHGRIVDADFAVETANLTRSRILEQAGTAMAAQANVSPQSVSLLLG